MDSGWLILSKAFHKRDQRKNFLGMVGETSRMWAKSQLVLASTVVSGLMVHVFGLKSTVIVDYFIFNLWIQKVLNKLQQLETNFTWSVVQWAVNIEPAICNGHLPYPWYSIWGRGVGCKGWGVSVAKCRHVGRGIQMFHIHQLAQSSLWFFLKFL